MTRTEGDKNISRIRPGFMLTEKSLTLHSKPEIQYEQSSKPWYKNPEPNRTRVKTSPTTGGKQGGTRESRANEENARGCFARFDHSYSQARKQCSCRVLGSRFTTANLEYTDTIYQTGR